MKNKITQTLSIALMTASFSGIATAEQADTGRRGAKAAGLMERIDANADGKISRDELAVLIDKRGSKIDANEDGQISEAELIKALPDAQKDIPVERVMAKLDTDGDGILTTAEMNAPKIDKMFERLDTDGDGAITMAEVKAARNHAPETK